MATLRADTRSAAARAASRALDAEIDATIAGHEPRYPNGTTFVGSDLVTDEMLREHHGEGLAVVVVDEHGNERFLPAP
jgi:hypothetical protein